MKRDEKFDLVNELSMAVTDQTVYDKVLKKDRVEYLANTNTLKINGQLKEDKLEQVQKIEEETEEELFARIYAQRKAERQWKVLRCREKKRIKEKNTCEEEVLLEKEFSDNNLFFFIVRLQKGYKIG